MNRVANIGIPQETGLKAAKRYHDAKQRRHVVKKDPKQLSSHKRCSIICQDMLNLVGSGMGRSFYMSEMTRLRDLYLGEQCSNAELIQLLPKEMVTQDNTFDEAAGRRKDVMNEVKPVSIPVHA